MQKTIIASLLSLLSFYPATASLMVDDVEEYSALQEAGLQPGDEIVEWRADRSQEFHAGRTVKMGSFFDWMYLVVEIAPRDTIHLYVNRSGTPKELTVRQGSWHAEVHPKISEELLHLLKRLEVSAREGNPQEAISEASELSEANPELHAWILLRIGRALSTASSPEPVWEAHIAAIEQATTPFSRGVIWDIAGSLHEELGDFQRAEQAYKAAISEFETLGKASLSYARGLYKLGRSFSKRGQPDIAETFLQEALALQEHLAPNSRPMAETLTELGTSLRARSHLDRATNLFRRALSIYESLSPSGIDTARLLSSLAGVAKARGDLDEAKLLLVRAADITKNISPDGTVYAGLLANLGNISFNEGDLIKALDYLEQSRRLIERISPNSLRMATVLEGLGIIAEERGDLESADDLNQKALHIRRSLAPESLDVANSLNIRGSIARARGRLDIAREAYLEALRIQERLDPNGLGTATTLNNLGSLVLSLHETDSAEIYYKKALSTQMRIAPISSATARTLANIGGVAHVRKRRTEAEILFRKALAILDKVAPGSLLTASTLRRLGNLLMENGELQEANTIYEEAAAICSTLAPGGPEEIRVLLALAKLSVLSGKPNMADRYFIYAIQSFESQMTVFGGNPDDRADFRANQSELYGRAIEFYLEHGRTELAFHILESFRARSFLEMLSERDLIFSEIPVDLETARRLIAKRYDITQSHLSSTNSDDNLRLIQRLTEELRRLWAEYQETSKKIRDSTPGLAAIQSPHPMTAREVSRQVDSGTVILSYLVNPYRSFVFILGADGHLKAAELPTGPHETLLEEVERFREMIRGTNLRSRTGLIRAQALEASGQKLYRMLIAPAETEIEKGQRVVIIPEASLHLLPWSALIRSASDHFSQRYFAEWRSLQIVQSATLYAQQIGASRSHQESSMGSVDRKIAAFGDPLFPRPFTGTPPAQLEDIRIRSAVERGLSFEQLPATRDEVAKIGNLFRAPSLFLGEEANEENAKTLARDIQIVHFATHSTLDEKTPLNSALVLSIPEQFDEERENGLLQAWEIFEQVRLNADLVVLSACETGLGKELSGEGLIGLTRAFQYAGARSVLASLWKISDRTTAELMVRFYKHLTEGKTKDEALRAAQIELIRGPIEITNEKGEVEKVDASAPYYWAAFQLYGDWQ